MPEPRPRAQRRLLFVSPHFPPDSSAGSHRARILAPHLEAFGWEPVVLTVDTDAIEGRPDLDLLTCIPTDLRVVRAAAVPLRRARTAGVGDLGLRALRGLYAEGRRLLETEKFDAVMVTTYPIYPAWLGPRFKRLSGLPFVLDLQDPWVGAWGRTVGPGGSPDLRSRLSRRVAVALERSIVPRADAIVAVSSGTIDELARRVPAVLTQPTMELPIGWEPADFERATRSMPTSIGPTASNTLQLSYVGTLLPAGHDVVRALACAANELARSIDQPLMLRFVGTSNQTRYAGPPLLENFVPPDAARLVSEHPERLPYLDALSVLHRSDVVLVLGTREPHYTASKVYPALASGKAVLAVLHQQSQAASVLRGASGTALVTLTSETGDSDLTERIADGLREVLRLVPHAPFNRRNILDPFRGDVLAGRLASLLDTVTANAAAGAHA